MHDLHRGKCIFGNTPPLLCEHIHSQRELHQRKKHQAMSILTCITQIDTRCWLLHGRFFKGCDLTPSRDLCTLPPPCFLFGGEEFLITPVVGVVHEGEQEWSWGMGTDQVGGAPRSHSDTSLSSLIRQSRVADEESFSTAEPQVLNQPPCHASEHHWPVY